MTPVTPRRAMWAFALALPTALASIAAAAERTTPSMFDPVSTPAFAIRELSYRVFGITGLIFVVVAGLAVYTLIRFRSRAGDERGEPPQIYGSTQIEIAWTVVPLIIVVVLFLVTARYIYGIERRAHAGRSARGHRRRASVVVGDPLSRARDRDRERDPRPGERSRERRRRPSSRSQSVDVVHSFWVPQLAGKMDVIPNKTNRMWIDPRTPGTYVGQCAEYCGTQHAWMLLLVVVHPRDEFERWVAAQRAPARDEVAAARPGPSCSTRWRASTATRCAAPLPTGCSGPDLTHLMSRAPSAAGAAPQYPGDACAPGWTTRPRSSPAP